MFLKGIKFSVLDLDTPKKGSKESSVHYGSQYRFNKAVQQAKLKPVSINKIINHVNKVLDVLGIDKVEKPIFKISGNRINYDNIIGTEVNNKSDLVWLKFTKDGYLGVVAAGRDINFDIPTSEEEYNIKKGKQWEYNTSGII